MFSYLIDLLKNFNNAKNIMIKLFYCNKIIILKMNHL